MRIEVGIIGGTGIGERLFDRPGRAIHVPTAAGILRGRAVEVGGRSALLIRRHSVGHKLPPHRVSYRAIALGLKSIGAQHCLSSAAVGSLREDWGPGTFVACSDFLDLSFRNLTLFDSTVEHRDFSEPFSAVCRQALIAAAGGGIQERGVYVCGNGPRYETPQEISTFRSLGGDVIGMTAATEAILLREAGIDYGCLAVVTNLAAGLSDAELSHGEVVAEMKRSGERAVAVLEGAVQCLPR